MSQKFIKYKNNNLRSTAYGKYYARAIYDKKPISTKEIANFIQTQATVKKSDCMAVLDELGAALKHYLAPKNRKDRGLQRNNKNSVPLYLCVE